MNAPLRRVGVVVLVLFGLLFANLNWVQGYQATEYRNSVYNDRVQLAEYERPRGRIVVAGTPVADSRATTGDLKYERTYSGAATYAHVVGYQPVNGAATGIERLYNELLAGTSPRLWGDRLWDMIRDTKTPGGNVELTISRTAQEVAVRELANNRVGASKGAVVALDPKTGKVLALASMPNFDPAPLVSHDLNAAGAAYNKLDKDPNKPLLNRAVSETYPPGSTMKVILAAAALQQGLRPDTVLTGGVGYQAPETTHVIGNAPGVHCPDEISLQQALTVSCNTAFARLGVEQLGADAVRAMAQAFGFEAQPRFAEDQEDNVFNVVASRTGDLTDPDGSDDRPKLAQSSIGQAEVRMTPLQGALIAATVANGGKQMRPYIVEKTTASDLSTIDTARPRTLRTPISGQVAADLRDMMVSVVEHGTGRPARINGYTVGGKTGTAETGESPDHGWFIGFVMKGDEPVAAVAVFLERAGNGGSAEATRIAGQVMRAVTGGGR
ncbi:MAG: penicillin-binding protein 2 [Micromonosporaceae bacterium]